ncbi:YfiR family protein [Glaciecola sp. 2405UD65-10]|uniref:YfiR family protein n=1 Tax=Glaciecola sp. 2405UD65-10 TaxID=3397244 RepID=UPI003B58BC84
MRTFFFSILIIPLLSYSSGSFANEKEYKLKAGFLYNFARFGHWETSLESNEYFELCSTSSDFVKVASKTLQGRNVHNLPILIRHISLEKEMLASCHMLFITEDTATDAQNSELISLKNIMLVGEADTFIENGGQIRFFLTGGKIRFEIYPQRLSDAGITMSSKVLRLARIVENVE